jgi:hypothetical protein
MYLFVLLREMIVAYSESHMDHLNTVFNLYLVVHIVTTVFEWLVSDLYIL